MSSWELIFQQSKVNTAAYDRDRLPEQNWHWPHETWFQKRLRYFRRSNGRDAQESTPASPKKDGACCSYARRDTRVAEEQSTSVCHVTRGSLRRYCGFTTQYTSRFGNRARRPDICPVHFWNSGFSVTCLIYASKVAKSGAPCSNTTSATPGDAK